MDFTFIKDCFAKSVLAVKHVPEGYDFDSLSGIILEKGRRYVGGATGPVLPKPNKTYEPLTWLAIVTKIVGWLGSQGAFLRIENFKTRKTHSCC